jgi:type IV pilus assembly protein PilC
MFVAILVSTGIFQWVVPQFALIFSTSNRELPWLTHQVILISEHFKIIMTTVGLTVMSTLITFMYFWKRFVSFQRRIDYLLMYLPIFGSIRQHALVTAWAKQLSQLLISQVPILDALSSLSLTASDWMIHDLCAHLHRHLEKGERIDLAIYRFKASKALFEESDLHLIELATGTGQLPETLQIIANHHENKLNEVMDHLEQMIEPILMLIMGLLIGTIVVALYLPIFEMGHSL